jgi:hypothetical protein
MTCRVMRAKTSPLFKLARVLVRLHHVASRIVNANHSLMLAAVELRVSDCIADRVWFAVPEANEWQRIEIRVTPRRSLRGRIS